MQKNNPVSDPLLEVIVDSMHPRVVYTLETVLQEFLGIQIDIVALEDVANRESIGLKRIPKVSYSYSGFKGPWQSFPCDGLLYEDGILEGRANASSKHDSETYLLPEDLFARIFFLISQYALYLPDSTRKLDVHGRYPDGDGSLVVHGYLWEISRALETIVPLELRNPPKFDFEITIDVDQPWKYKHKALHVVLGGFFKDLLRGQFSLERWKAFLGKTDPFEVLTNVRAICPPEKTKVFFLVAGEHRNDSRFDLDQAAYQKLVLEWKSIGFEVGIHPSYETYLNPSKTLAEKKKLEVVIGHTEISRQHYLRYQVPETFAALAQMGIRREYSLCLSAKSGAATGVAFPYRWFDLRANCATEMVMVPAMVMDRTLLQYLGLSPEQAQASIAEWISKVKTVGGKFVIILHNETFSESGEWKGWLPVIRNMVAQLKE